MWKDRIWLIEYIDSNRELIGYIDRESEILEACVYSPKLTMSLNLSKIKIEENPISIEDKVVKIAMDALNKSKCRI